MRLICEAYKQLKEDDPNTNLTIYALHTIVNSGEIPVVKVGRKTLINYDALLDYFDTGKIQEVEPVSGKIRRIDS